MAIGHSEGKCAGEGVPPPAQSAEAKTILLFCKMQGKTKKEYITALEPLNKNSYRNATKFLCSRFC